MNGGGDGLESASLVRHGSSSGRSYMSEGGVQREGLSGHGGGGAGSGGPAGTPRDTTETGDELDYVESDAPLLSQFHEDAIQQAGTGAFQRLLLLIVGLGLAADTIEIFVVAYVIPSAEVELCMSGTEKGWLAAITFIGMMIGAMIWGSLSDNVGRRRALLSALFINALFGIMTAFMPTYGNFMTTRLCSGIGIGGGIPIVFAYYCEFVTQAERGRQLSWLLVFWAIGGVFTALMAWIIIPRTGITVVLDEELHFSSWRIFLVVCSLPSFAAVIGLYHMPESPRFLLEKGREVEAMMVYKKIFKWNNAHNPGAEYQISELELPSGTQRPLRRSNSPQTTAKTFGADITHGLENSMGHFLQLFAPPYFKITILLLIVWLTSSFGFYGLSVWFPEYIKLLKSEEYSKNATIVNGKVFQDYMFNNTRLDNIQYLNTNFENVTFRETVLNHVLFLNCSLTNCIFSDIRSSKTFFKYSTLFHINFTDTDMHPYRFPYCDMEDITFHGLAPGCTLDFDYNIHYKEIFQENLIGQLTMIPGTLAASLFMDKLGRVKVMSISFALSSVSAFFIWFLKSKAGVIVFEAVFNFIFISGWNGLDIATTEAFPTHIRTTAYGFLSAASRIAGVLGSLCFGQFIYSSQAIPMLTTSAVLMIGAIVSLKLKETKDNLI
ncbi:synaptic vesicle glycoprotein 2C-like isoform X2 [Eriocheir sinensis]|nr:synaptic vesicle glycoprotein 2C-like isoform X2 [Eriocheir sinensis]XP_050731005.1 synaptic vesicle glycoprotein 2C-like isoform X2 [Eriocheir sinensis]